MRLWHEKLIPTLSTQRLLGQHRECCALRGKAWGRKHSTVDYVFKYSRIRLYRYHMIVINELTKRGISTDDKWCCMNYCGKQLDYAYDPFKSAPTFAKTELNSVYGAFNTCIYPEHDDAYLELCIKLLKEKGDKSYVRN